MDLPVAQTHGDANGPLPLIDTTLQGEVATIIFANDETGYAVIRLLADKRQEHVLVGRMPGVAPGQEIEASGHWETHKDHGRQFRVNEFRTVLPSSETGIIRYLSSGVIPGIGPKMAERIVEKFGTETLHIIANFSSRLLEVEGLGKSKLQAIREAWTDQNEQRDIYVYLQGLGISSSYCDRIYRTFGNRAAALVRENPYILAKEVRGIGFRMADAVAAALHIAKDHPFRLGAGVDYVLNQMTEQDGHTGVPQDELLRRAAEILGVTPEIARIGVDRAVLDGAIVVDDHALNPGQELVYPMRLYQAELELGDQIRRILATPAPALPENREKPEYSLWDKLNDEQREAVRAAFKGRLSVITGGPGVGKTTVTREICTWAKHWGMSVALAAPTGRAAKRLSESTHLTAHTIHRLLRWLPDVGGFHFGTEEPLSHDLLIVDEVSMLDVQLAVQLMRAVSDTCRVVLVGDRDQLPSVGPGSVLRDIIRARVCPITHLEKVYRQAAHSRIITAAHAVNQGLLPSLKEDNDEGGKLSDFYWIRAEEADHAVALIRKLVVERIPQRFGHSAITDIQVLAPMVKGTCGVTNLNHVLQDALNPRVKGRPELQGRDATLRIGDRVMQITNNYDRGVFNGEQGNVSGIDPGARTFTVTFDIGDVEYPFEEAEQLRLAYAITIHKSQGSEFPVVIVPVLSQHYVMLRRNLIYTAMTRARKLLVMLGSERALSMAVRNINTHPRHSRLADRITLPPGS